MFSHALFIYNLMEHLQIHLLDPMRCIYFS